MQDLLRRAGRRGDAVVALRRAPTLAPAGGSDRADLTRRLAELES